VERGFDAGKKTTDPAGQFRSCRLPVLGGLV
jgi:hypothetical protein